MHKKFPKNIHFRVSFQTHESKFPGLGSMYVYFGQDESNTHQRLNIGNLQQCNLNVI